MIQKTWKTVVTQKFSASWAHEKGIFFTLKFVTFLLWAFHILLEMLPQLKYYCENLHLCSVLAVFRRETNPILTSWLQNQIIGSHEVKMIHISSLFVFWTGLWYWAKAWFSSPGNLITRIAQSIYGARPSCIKAPRVLHRTLCWVFSHITAPEHKTPFRKGPRENPKLCTQGVILPALTSTSNGKNWSKHRILDMGEISPT